MINLKRLATGILNRFGLQVHRTPSKLSVWDVDFLRWIHAARARGIDPNDLGDEEWATDRLDTGMSKVYGPLLAPESRILELGPGTGRLSRHLVGKNHHLIVVDRSRVVCDWIAEYLAGKGEYSVIHSSNSSVSAVQSESIDVVIAHGVFEHFDLDTMYWFLLDFKRVLKPSGSVAFNFNNALSAGGLAHLRATSTADRPSVFRFHAPDAISAVATAVGFDSTEIRADSGRVAFAIARGKNSPQ